MSQSSTIPSSPHAGQPHAPLAAGTVVTLAASGLSADLIESLTSEFARHGSVTQVQSAQFPTRAVGAEQVGAEQIVPVPAARWAISSPGREQAQNVSEITAALEAATAPLTSDAEAAPVTATVLPASRRPGARAMLLMDVDSTLIDEEVIDLIARRAGRQAEVAAVTEAAMRGELDFAGSLHRRVAALEGLPVSVFDEVLDAVHPTCGAGELLAAAADRGWPRAAVSGGFRQVLTPLAARLGLTDHHANTLGVEDGLLTGTVQGAVVDGAAKARYLHETAAAYGLTAQQVIAIGDGANDIDMTSAAGVGVAFCAKPALEEHTTFSIRHRSLQLVSWALGV